MTTLLLSLLPSWSCGDVLTVVLSEFTGRHRQGQRAEGPSPRRRAPLGSEHCAPSSHLPSTCSPFWSPADNGHQVPFLYPPPPRPNTHTNTRPPYRAGRELRLFLHVARRDSHRQPCWPDARGKGVCSRNPAGPTQAGTPTVRGPGRAGSTLGEKSRAPSSMPTSESDSLCDLTQITTPL